MKIIWSPLALERIEDISRYIAEDNPDAALQWVNDLFATVERLADFPKSGRMVPEVGAPRIRELIFGTYRVIYSVKDQVNILTVRRSSQLLRMSEVGDLVMMKHNQRLHSDRFSAASRLQTGA